MVRFSTKCNPAFLLIFLLIVEFEPAVYIFVQPAAGVLRIGVKVVSKAPAAVYLTTPLALLPF